MTLQYYVAMFYILNFTVKSLASKNTIFFLTPSLELFLEIKDLHQELNYDESILSHAHYDVISHEYAEQKWQRII